MIFFLCFKKFLYSISTNFNISVATSQENKKKCRINTNKQILDFIKKELNHLKLVVMKKDQVIPVRPKMLRDKTLL